MTSLADEETNSQWEKQIKNKTVEGDSQVPLTAKAKQAGRAFRRDLVAGDQPDEILAAALVQARGLGAFAEAIQQGTEAALFAAKEPCRVAGVKGQTNRQYFRGLIERYILGNLPLLLKEHLTEAEARDKFLPQDQGDVFNRSDLRKIHDVAKFMLNQGQEKWLDQLLPLEVLSLKDVSISRAFRKANSAESAYRRAIKHGGKFEDKDAADLGLYDEWKADSQELRSGESFIPEVLGSIDKEMGKLRDLQRSRSQELGEKTAEAKGGIPRISLEDVALFVPAFEHFLKVGDVREYIRLSTNQKDGRVRLPDPADIPPEARNGFVDRVTSRAAKNRGKVLQVLREMGVDEADLEPKYGVTVDELCLLAELMYRDVDRISRMATRWKIHFWSAWEHWGYGQYLIDDLKGPKDFGQGLQMVGTSAHHFVLGMVGIQTEVGGRTLKMRLVPTIVAFFLAYGAIAMISNASGHQGEVGPTLLWAVVVTAIYRILVGWTEGLHNPVPIHLLFLLFVVALIVVPAGSCMQGGIIEEQNRQHTDNVHCQIFICSGNP